MFQYPHILIPRDKERKKRERETKKGYIKNIKKKKKNTNRRVESYIKVL